MTTTEPLSTPVSAATPVPTTTPIPTTPAADAPPPEPEPEPEPEPSSPGDLFAPLDPDSPAEAVAGRLLAATLGYFELKALHAGRVLGWYDALRAHGPTTSAELARATGTQERYAREWLEGQAASGWLCVDDAAAGATERRYRLGAGVAEVVTDEDSLWYLGALTGFVAACDRTTDDLLAAYRDGGGVSWAQLGDDARAAQAALNRPFFLGALAQEVLPALPELDATLTSGARVAELGSGFGWAAVAIARAYPGTRVDGFDVDVPSVERARANAAAAGVADRVAFTAADAVTLDVPADERYDAVVAFECLHDLPDPVGALSAARRIVRPGGYVLVMDERVEDAFGAPAGPVERFYYGCSQVCCLPDSLSHAGSVGTGTVMRAPTFARYAEEAGFAATEVLPVEHDMFRFYRLRP